MESEAIKFDEYLANDLEKRFEFLYENYSIMKILIKDYKEDLITDEMDDERVEASVNEMLKEYVW
jgi:hypothetical protein